VYNKSIILSVTNDLVTDQRVHKVASSLHEEGFKVTVVGRELKNSLQIDRDYKTKRFRLFFNSKVWFYAEYNLRLFFYLLFHKADLYISNDLDTLLPNFLVSKLKKKSLIYDSHELFCEVPELNERKFQKSVWKKLEEFLLPKSLYNITVCKSISDEYKKQYGSNFEVVRNVPLRKLPCKITEKDEVILIYQGALNKDRGIELMIESMKFMPDYKLWIVGSGDLDDELVSLASDVGVKSNVKFLGRKNFEELTEVTCKATLGLSLERDTSASYHFALPNKLFDYIQAEIPVVVSDLPEMKRIVKDFHVGEVFEGRTAEELSILIVNLIKDKPRYNSFVLNSKKASQELIWEKEKKVYISMIEKVLA